MTTKLMIEYRCCNCGKLLFRAPPGTKVEIKCDRPGCKKMNRFNIDSERLERQ